MIGRTEVETPELAVVADMEAGLEHLSWAGGTLAYVDVLCIVAEPTAKSLVTAARTRRLAAELGIGHVGLVANRVTADAHARLDDFAAEHHMEVLARLPDDPLVRRADQAGVSPLDHASDSPIAAGLAEFAGLLAGRYAAGSPAVASDG